MRREVAMVDCAPVATEKLTGVAGTFSFTPGGPRIAAAEVFAFAMLYAFLAHGDTVYLRNGWSVEGRVVREGGRVTVISRTGRISFDEDAVERIEEKETDEEIFDARLKAIDPRDADGLFELGQWAADRKMEKEARIAWRKVLEAAPDHPAARVALGYGKFEGKWLGGEDLMRARGFVKWKGQFVPAEAVAELQKVEMEREIESLRAEAERLRLARAEVELEKVRAEASAAERSAVESESAVKPCAAYYVYHKKVFCRPRPGRRPHQDKSETCPASESSSPETGSGFIAGFRDGGTGFTAGFRDTGTGFWAGR